MSPGQSEETILSKISEIRRISKHEHTRDLHVISRRLGFPRFRIVHSCSDQPGPTYRYSFSSHCRTSPVGIANTIGISFRVSFAKVLFLFFFFFFRRWCESAAAVVHKSSNQGDGENSPKRKDALRGKTQEPEQKKTQRGTTRATLTTKTEKKVLKQFQNHQRTTGKLARKVSWDSKIWNYIFGRDPLEPVYQSE